MTPNKTVTCGITGETISKRKSIQIEHNAKFIRVKRDLPEVGQYLAKLQEENINKAAFAKMNHNMQVLSLVSFIQVQNSVNPLFPKAMFLLKIERTQGKKVREDVEKELSIKNSLTPEDIAMSLLSYGALLAKLPSNAPTPAR